MQLQVERGVIVIAEVGDLFLEIGDATPEPRDFQSKSLLVAVAYVAQ